MLSVTFPWWAGDHLCLSLNTESEQNRSKKAVTEMGKSSGAYSFGAVTNAKRIDQGHAQMSRGKPKCSATKVTF